ncbi:hypothetical protein R3P38DRAFT_3240425 [Favolaschia claudopus]|uniref:F-box domain-containing protein n=1 Tax=Favolaschia claudopus TaxID=2862362 RepID=A0AAV9Z6C9_9AGAR
MPAVPRSFADLVVNADNPNNETLERCFVTDYSPPQIHAPCGHKYDSWTSVLTAWSTDIALFAPPVPFALQCNCAAIMLSSSRSSPVPKRVFVASSSGLVFPPEILGEIVFLACGPFDEYPATYHQVRKDYLLVCTEWKDMITGDPRFWTGLYVCRAIRPQQVITAFTNARGLPVHLIIDAPSRIASRNNFEQTFASLRDHLDDHIDKIGRLSVSATDQFGAQTLFEWMESCHAHRVRQLDLAIGTTNPPNPLLLNRAILAFSNLETLVHRYSHLLIPYVHASTLRRLHLGPMPRTRCDDCWNEVRDFLMACVGVTHLVLDDVMCANGPPQGILVQSLCHMPSVTHMAFKCDSYGNSYLWAALRVPSLRVLQFIAPSGCADFVDGTTPHLCNPSLDGVEVLDLRMSVPSDLTMKNILANFPNLVHLDLRRVRHTIVVALVEMRPFVSAPLCRNLSSIHLGTDMSTFQLLRVLGNRQSGHFAEGCTVSYEFISGIRPYAWTRTSFRFNSGVLEEVPYEEPVYVGLDF